ncbi:MAG: transposase [Chlamydiales bacterium]|jgi:transposase
MEFFSPDERIPQDHKARRVWEFVEKIDTEPCFRKSKTMVGSSGQPTTCPRVLFALWLYAFIDGVSSGRKISELCKEHDAYRWIADEVPINRTMLCDFRSSDPTTFNVLLTRQCFQKISSVI